MANTSKQDTAVRMANDLIVLCGQAKALYDATAAFNQRNTDNSPDTLWRTMATATVNADGSISQTADGTPVLAHPITVAGLDRAEADLLPGLTFAIEFAQFMAGTLPTGRAAVNRLTVVDNLIG